MTLNYTMLAALIFASVTAAAPLLLATTGGILCERSGHLNLGIEGMMLMGAVTGFSVGDAFGNPLLSLAAAALAGALGAAVYAFITISLLGNQVVTGLALSIFGIGYANFSGSYFTKEGFKMLSPRFKEVFAPLSIAGLKDVPVAGRLLFSYDIMVYFAFFAALCAGLYLYKTRPGLTLRAVGENPSAADAAGIAVHRYKYIHCIVGGALCGLGGAYYSLVAMATWQNDITAGAGWIAVALIIFSQWNPYKAMASAILFGGLRIFYIYQNSLGIAIPINPYFIQMLPYFATILALVITGMKHSRKNRPPAALGLGYFREER